MKKKPHLCDVLAAERPSKLYVTTPRCDVCGTDAAPLTRELVEGIVCERCPDCARDGLVP